MNKLNLLVHLNGYQDANASNNPSYNNFKWNRDIQGINISEPTSKSLTLAAGQTASIFSGAVTTAADLTTTWNIALKAGTSQTYILSRAAGTSPAFRAARAIGTDATTPVTVTQNATLLKFTSPASVAAATATFTGQAAGMTTDVTFDADVEGTDGNDIVLVGDGTSTLVELSDAWNTANPSNQIVQDIGDFSQVLDLGAEIQLAGGVDSVTGMNMAAVQIGDDVRIGTAFNPLNRGKFKVLAKTATSFTIENPAGAPEGPIVLGAQFADQINMCSAAGVQVGDKVDLIAGFSSVSFGTYEITDATPDAIEIYSIEALPTESGISNNPAAMIIYSQAKSFVYIESDQKLEIKIDAAAQPNTLQPMRAGSAGVPGVFMSSSSMKSLEVTNKSLETATIFYVTAE